MFTKSVCAAVLATVAATAAAACSSDDGAGRACSTIGCAPEFQLDVVFDGAAAEVPQMTIEVCRNTECLTGSFAKAGVPQGDLAASITFPDPSTLDATESPHADAMISDSASTGRALGLRLQYRTWVWGAVADGDVYTVKVRRGSTVVTSVEKAVTYSVSYPNGVECGPACKSSTF